MDTTPGVADITTYLVASGWQRAPRPWHGASVWHHRQDYEVLVPANDDLRDSRARIGEILRCLSALEQRPAGDILQEITRPEMDLQYLRTFPEGHAPGYTSLAAGMHGITGVHNLLALAARTAIQGPHFSFSGRSPNAVTALMDAAELGPTRQGSHVIEVRLAATARFAEDLTGRAVFDQVFEAVAAASVSVGSGEEADFTEAVTAGVSANLCHALARLGGPDHDGPFELGFRWGRAVAAETGTELVAFGPGSATVLNRAADRLRDLDASGPATVTGVIETLHNGTGADEQWRISVRGQLQTASGRSGRRKIWVRLPDESGYERAIAAHHSHRTVRVAGELSSQTGRIELVPDRQFDVLD